MRARSSTATLLLMVALLWGLNFTAGKYVVTHGFSPTVYAALRFFIAGLVFAGITFGREGSLRVARSDVMLVAAAAAAFGVGLNQVAFVYALRLTTAAAVAVVFGTFPARRS